MQREFVESMKTIAQSAVERAGFDKTRNGKIVGVNSITNTYSVKVDGIVYNNVKTVNDITCNKGDTVKVNIPMNNPSQAYITSSVLSDDSIGSKLAVVDEAIDQIDNKIDGIVEIMNSIYQLSISVAYDNDPNNIGYKLVTYTALLTQDGVNVTDTHDPSEFRWYLEKTEGQQEISGSPARSVRLSTKDYFYGQAIMLEWTYMYTDSMSAETKTAQLRSRVTLISNDAITQVAKYTTDLGSNIGVFVHRADGNYDVGTDWTSPWAYGVKITETVDIIKGGEIYGSFGGNYLTIGHTSQNNIYMDSNTFIQLRKGTTVLTDIKPGSITLGRTASSYYNTYMDDQHLYFRQGSTILTSITGTGITLGKTSAYSYYTYIDNSSLNFRYMYNSSSYRTLMSMTGSGMSLYNYAGTQIATFQNNNIIMGVSSDNITIGNTALKCNKNNIYVGGLRYNSYKNDSNIYGLVLEVQRGGATQRPGYVGLTSIDSNNDSWFRWIYIQDNVTQISGWTAGMLNAGCSIDMNNWNITNIGKLYFGDYYINSLNLGGLYISGILSTASRMLVGNVNYGYTLDVNGTAYISGNTHVGRLYLYDSTEASSKTANARLTTGSWPARLCFVNSSSSRYKHDIKLIENNEINPHLLYNVNVVQFKFNNDYLAKDDQRYGQDVPGFIAENIAKEYPIAADINDDGTVEDWNERFIIPPMLKLIQEQKQMIDDLERRLSQLEQKE